VVAVRARLHRDLIQDALETETTVFAERPMAGHSELRRQSCLVEVDALAAHRDALGDE
jgi:hypothetical protein